MWPRLCHVAESRPPRPRCRRRPHHRRTVSMTSVDASAAPGSNFNMASAHGMVVAMRQRTLRECRTTLGKSQAEFAVLLGASPETYRPWDAGRRRTPPQVLARARAMATHRNESGLLPLPVRALLLGVHVKTLRFAARTGRLPVIWDTRTTFRRLRARATPAAAREFKRTYYGRRIRPEDRTEPPNWSTIPPGYDVQIRRLRQQRGLSQTEFATALGAAGKVVVYQCETRRRCPSPVFWNRIQQLAYPPIGTLSQSD